MVVEAFFTVEDSEFPLSAVFNQLFALAHLSYGRA